MYEIVSADSVQVYKYLDIGSGKLLKKELQLIPHHLINIVEPDYSFTAGDFCRRADSAVNEILDKDKWPIFVGGTGLYIDSFFKGMSNIPQVSEEVRSGVLEQVEREGLKSLYSLLERVDPQYAGKIHPNDSQRIIRAIEVYRGTGKAISYYHAHRQGRESASTLYIGLWLERDVLRKKIDMRVDKMVKDGFFDEVAKLREMGFSKDLRSMKSIGYNEINAFFDGLYTREETIDKIKTVTKQYAKRQMTWFRKNKSINWFSSDEKDKALEKIENWVKR